MNNTWILKDIITPFDECFQDPFELIGILDLSDESKKIIKECVEIIDLNGVDDDVFNCVCDLVLMHILTIYEEIREDMRDEIIEIVELIYGLILCNKIVKTGINWKKI